MTLQLFVAGEPIVERPKEKASASSEARGFLIENQLSGTVQEATARSER